MNDLEFVFHPGVQAIFEHFNMLHRIRMAFYSPAGVELRVDRIRPNCAYCRLLRGRLGYENQCLRLDRVRRDEAKQLPRGLLTYRCHGGMNEAVMPVRVNGQLLGVVMIGQFRTHKAVPRGILRKVKNARTRRQLQTAFESAPLFTARTKRHVLGLFEVLVEFITAHHMIELKDVLGPILRRLREHPEQRLTLIHAAAMVGRSPTTLSHLFRRKLGKSFRTVRIELAMEKADEYFHNVPGIRVKEVARRLGFDDPLYFSRLYRRYRGQPPSRFELTIGTRREAGE